MQQIKSHIFCLFEKSAYNHQQALRVVARIRSKNIAHINVLAYLEISSRQAEAYRKKEQIIVCKKTWAFIGICFITFGYYLDFTIVNTALPNIQKALSISVLQLQWVMNIYALIFSAFLIISGRLSDTYGRRNFFLGSSTLFAVSTLFAGFSQNLMTLVIFRALQSLAGTMIVTTSLALLQSLYDNPKAHTKAIGTYMAVVGIGLSLGPFIGGLVTSALSWRWVFFTIVPFIFIGLLLCLRYLKGVKQTNTNQRIDWLGSVFLATTLATLIYALTLAETTGWGAISTLSFFAISAITLVLLLFIEKKVSDPILNFSLLKNHSILLSMLICVSASVVIGALLFFNPLYLSISRQLSPRSVGAILTVIPLMQVLISLFFRKIYERWQLSTLAYFAIISALIASALQFTFHSNSSFVVLILSYLLCGITWGLANTSAPAVVKSAVPGHKTAATLGAIYVTWNISSAILLALASTVFNMRERISMNNLINNLHLMLTPTQHTQIKTLLSDPAKAQSTLDKLTSQTGTKLLPAYHQAFLSGFHAMILSMLIVLISVLLITYRVTKSNHAK